MNVNENRAAAILGLSVQTLRNWRCMCRGPRYARLGRAIRYNTDDLEKYIAQNTISPQGHVTEVQP